MRETQLGDQSKKFLLTLGEQSGTVRSGLFQTTWLFYTLNSYVFD